MHRIRLLQVGPENNSIIHNLAVSLSRVQNAYGFDFNDDVISLDPNLFTPDGFYPPKYLEQIVAKHMFEHEYNEFPIAITNVRLPEDIVTSNDDRSAIISTHGWSSYCSYPLIKGLEYLVAAILLDFHITTESHYDTRGCPNDYCDELSDINIGIQKAEFCESCTRGIFSALERGLITLQEVTAINRMLDDVAGRKVCFVLIPFSEEFKQAYESIKAAVTLAGFTCYRADEIFQTRSIIQIIYDWIGRAEIVVADLTGRNPNVFYELGYAHALGKSTVLVTQDRNDVPFDLRHRQYVLYELGDLQITLGKSIQAYFR